MVVRQGELFWIDAGEPRGSEPGFRRPHVVVQGDALNRSQIRSVIVCPLTSNLSRARIIGNVLLKAGEANLPQPSVVIVSQIATFDRGELKEYIGTLSLERLHQIWSGIRLSLEPSPR